MPRKIKMILSGYKWPGNVAELEEMIKSMVVCGNPDKIEEILGGSYTNDRDWKFADLYDDFSPEELSDLKQYLGDLNKASLKEICRAYKIRVEAKLMKKALVVSNWNRKKTARMLNISYKSLLNKISEYGLENN
jgi:two-component system response regulator AtoC